jgi:small subunit ribosomal protein S20
MANHFSALKAARQIERRTEINRHRKTRLRHQIRALRRAIEKKDVAGAQALLGPTFSLVDRAARWGIVKRNTAARYKSRLHLRLKKLAAPAAA